MAKYAVIVEQEDGWSDWVQPTMKLYKMACCDCGLVHNFKFRVVKGRGGVLKVQMKAQRNNRATGQVRRHKRKK